MILVDFRVNDYKKMRPRQHQDQNYMSMYEGALGRRTLKMNVIWYYQQHKASKTNSYGTFPKICQILWFFFTFEFGTFGNFLSIWFELIFKNFGKWIEHVIAFSGLTNFWYDKSFKAYPTLKQSIDLLTYKYTLYVCTIKLVS